MAAMSDYLEAQVLNHVFRNTAIFTTPTAVYVALFTTATTDAGGGSEVPNLYGYARKAITTTAGTAFTAPAAAGETHNAAEQAFAAASGGSWGTVTHFAIVDSGTYGAGNFLFHGALNASKLVNDGDVFRFIANALSITLA